MSDFKSEAAHAAEPAPSIASPADPVPPIVAGDAPTNACGGGGTMRLCRLSAAALIALWGKKMAEEAKRREAKVERETDMLETQLNQFIRDSMPRVELQQSWNWADQTAVRDTYVWVFTPKNPPKDPQIIERCVDRINARNKSPAEASRWLATATAAAPPAINVRLAIN